MTLQEVIKGYSGLHRVTRGYRGITMGYKRLQEVTRDYSGLHRVTRDYVTIILRVRVGFESIAHEAQAVT